MKLFPHTKSMAMRRMCNAYGYVYIVISIVLLVFMLQQPQCQCVYSAQNIRDYESENSYQQLRDYRYENTKQKSFNEKYQNQHHQQLYQQYEGIPRYSGRVYNHSMPQMQPMPQPHIESTAYQQHQDTMQPNRHQSGRMPAVRPNLSAADRMQHKCKIWVPTETIDKYPWESKIQVDQSNLLQLIEVCCPGYGPVRWRGNTICRPLCSNCHNGLCVEPDVCQCYEEFVRNDNGDCVFTCPLGCLNGRCYLDGTCQCDPGYKLDETRKFCRPICSAGCGQNERHNCTEPEVCGCTKGYQLTDDGCQPICEPECGVGGYCREHNVCECVAGYNLKDRVCQSDCYQKCDNGICYARNRCICNPGYTYHERSTQCVPS